MSDDNTPKDQETNLLKSFTESTGNVPLLNRPKSGLAHNFPLTGYRDHTDDNGKNNKDAAVEFLKSLDAIPKDEEGKFNVHLLNNIPVEPGSAAPLEMFRRGLLELGAHSFLHNDYPEWIGDATDDANADLEALQYFHLLKEFGYERLNDDLNAKPAPHPDYPDDVEEDWEYPEENILFHDFSAITQELLVLMTGRAETKRLREIEDRQRESDWAAKHEGAIKWAKEQFNLDLHHDPSETQGMYTQFYVEPDNLTGYIIWDNPYRIAVKKVRPNTDSNWWGDEGVIHSHYIIDVGKTNASTYPTEQPATR